MRSLLAAAMLCMATTASAAQCLPLPAAYPPKPTEGIAYRRHTVTERFIQRRLVERPFGTIAIGDSIMGMWPHELLESKLGGPVLNAGRGGATTLDWIDWLDEWDWSIQQPSVVYITIGRNDMSYGICPTGVADSIITLIKKVKAKFPGARVVWQSVIPSGFYLAERARDIVAVNALVRSQAGPLGFAILDAYTVIQYHCRGVKVCGLFYAGDDFQGTGPVHLGANGYEAIFLHAEVLP